MFSIGDCPIDLCRKKITVGSLIGVYGYNYPISYWYIYGFNGDNVTLIGLDNDYNLLIDKPKIVQTDMSSIQYFEVGNAPIIDVPANYILHYYQNRYRDKKPKYGDVVLLETQFITYKPYMILNYDPLSNVHLVKSLCYDLYERWTRNTDLNLAFCHYRVVSTKELRRDIHNRSQEIRNNLERKNYEQINILDQIIEFTAHMNYIYEKTDLTNIKLRELDFLDNLELIPQEYSKEMIDEKQTYLEADIENQLNQNDENPLDYLLHYSSRENSIDCEYNYFIENDLEETYIGQSPRLFLEDSPKKNDYIELFDSDEIRRNDEEAISSPILCGSSDDEVIYDWREDKINGNETVLNNYYNPWITKAIIDIDQIIEISNQSKTDENYINNLVMSLKGNEPKVVVYSLDDNGDCYSESSYCPDDWYKSTYFFEKGDGEPEIEYSCDRKDESYQSSSSEDDECLITTSYECNSETIEYDNSITCEESVSSTYEEYEANEDINNHLEFDLRLESEDEMISQESDVLEQQNPQPEQITPQQKENGEYDEVGLDEIEPWNEDDHQQRGCSIM